MSTLLARYVWENGIHVCRTYWREIGDPVNLDAYYEINGIATLKIKIKCKIYAL